LAAARGSMRMVATFLAVGAAGAGAYVALSTAFNAAGAAAWIASIAAYATTIPAVYLAQRNFTFQSRAPHLSSFPKYVASQLLGLTLAGILPYVVAQGIGLPPVVAFALVAVTIAAVNLFVLRFWAFAEGPLQ